MSAAQQAAPGGVLAVMDAEIASLPHMAMLAGTNGVSCDATEAVARMQQALATIAELIEAARSASAYMATEMGNCGGNRCRETWCAGCFGEDSAEITVDLARKSGRRLQAALAAATGGEQ